MNKLTATAKFSLLFLAVALVGFIWTLNGGTPDGSQWVMYVFGGLFLLLGLLSKLTGGGWFTDRASKP